MNKQKQYGSAHVIIIAALIIVLVGILSFVFWQNFMTQKTPETTQTDNSTTENPAPSVALKVARIDSSYPVQFSWRYPENWTMSVKGDPPKSHTDSTDQTITITSPSKDYEVVYKVGINRGYGGQCSPDPDSYDAIEYIRRETITEFPDTIFTEIINRSYSVADSQKKLEGYDYSFGIYNGVNHMNSVKTSESICKVYLKNVFELSETPNMTLFGASIRLKKIETLDQYGDVLPFKDIETIKAALESDEYKDAVKILRSTRKE